MQRTSINAKLLHNITCFKFLFDKSEFLENTFRIINTMQTKPVASHGGCTIVGVVGADGQAGPPFSVFQEGEKIAEGFGSIEDAEEWIDTNTISPPTPEEDEDEGTSSPRPI